MGVLIVVVLVVFLVVVFRTGRARVARPERPAEPRIEGLPNLTGTRAPDGWVTVHASLGPEEAIVARGLLEANGIPTALESLDPMVIAAYPVPARRMRLCVAPENAAEAAALLRDLG
jgi:hypothetical protein